MEVDGSTATARSLDAVRTASSAKKKPPTSIIPGDDARRRREGASTRRDAGIAPLVLSSHSTPYQLALGSLVDVATGPTYLIVPRKSLSSRILVPTHDCGGPFVASRRAAIFF